MKGIKQQARQNMAMQVIQRTNEGLSVKDACKALGIPRSTFYSITTRYPELVAEMQEMIQEFNRQQLATVLVSDKRVLDKLIQQGLDENISPRDRLAIFIALEKLQNKYASMVMGASAEQPEEPIILTGPVLRPGKSRFDWTEASEYHQSDSSD